MKLILLVALTLSLQGCWFIYIPASVFQSGNTCVSDSAYIGQRILNRHSGKYGTVKELHGRSDRCQSGDIPIVATVSYD